MDADEAAAAAFIFKLNDAGDFGEQRVIFANTDVHARLKFRAALAYQDRAAADELPAKALHTEALRMTVAAVA